MNKFCFFTLLLLLVVSCSQRTPAEKLVDILEKAAAQIRECNSEEEILKVENETQKEIAEITKDFKPNAEDAKLLEPALNSYYQAFYDKALSLGLDGGPDQYGNENTDLESQDTDSMVVQPAA